MEIIHEINFLDPQKLALSRDSMNRLKLKLEGEGEFSEVKLLRCFPMTDLYHYISLHATKEGDKDAQEIGILKDSQALDPASRTILVEELELRYFTPKITRIYKIKAERGADEWEVETNKGRRTFATRYREDMRILPPRRVMLKDVDGNRFEITDYAKLDALSRRFLEKRL